MSSSKQNSVDEQPDLPIEQHSDPPPPARAATATPNTATTEDKMPSGVKKGAETAVDMGIMEGSKQQLHPASYRPSNLTVANNGGGANNRGVSIIINPMQSEGSGNNGSESRYHPGSEPGPTLVAGPSSSTSAAAAAQALSTEVMGISVDCGSPGGTESPGTSQMSPPPSYHDIPGTVPVHQGASRGPPPSYEDAVDPNAPPPSYDSLFGRIRDTHKTSRNFIDFLVKLFVILLGTIGCTIACWVTIVIPVCMIVVGAVYFDECPAEPYIPVFLIVGGSFSVFKYLIGVVTRVRSGRNNGGGEQDADNAAQGHPAQSIISCFLCGWFITGCVWVYRIYKPLMDLHHAGDPAYCHKTVYIFAFWLITTAYIFLGLFTSCICCISVITVILKKEF